MTSPHLPRPIVVGLDLDGTLLRSDRTLSQRSRSILERLPHFDVRPVVATARPPRTTEELLGTVLSSAPRVCYSGAWVTIDATPVCRETIDIPVANAVIASILSRAPDATVCVEIDDVLYADRPVPFIQPPRPIDFSESLDRAPVKIMVNLDNLTLPDDLFRELPEPVALMVLDGGSIAILMPKHVNKMTGLQIVLDHWKLSRSHAIAFGDDLGDIPMLRSAAIGIAMSNAPPEVQAAADHIAPSNDEDGVAQVLESLLTHFA